MLLAKFLSNHFNLINSRLNTFSGIIKSLILCRGCRYKNMAEEIEGKILFDSKIKSVSRFLSGDNIDNDAFFELICRYLPQGKLILTIDRTIWEFGKHIRNVLFIGASYSNIAMPLVFKIIPYRGACTAADQIELLELVIEKVGIHNIDIVMGDREFDGEKLLHYLHFHRINYALRIRKTNRIMHENQNVRLENIGDKTLENYDTYFYNVPVKINHFKLKTGEYLTVVSNREVSNAHEKYRRRWDIESCFKACKTNGFFMEKSHITNEKRFVNFLRCICIAYALTIRTGEKENIKRQIKIKKTLKSRAYSIFQFGLKTIKETALRGRPWLEKLFQQIIIWKKLGRDPIFVR